MLRTPQANEGQGGALREDEARARGNMVNVRDQVAQLAADNGLKVSDSLLPTTTASYGGSSAESHLARKPGRTTVTDLRMVIEEGLFETGGKLLPTPNTMEHLPARTGEARERQLRRGEGDGASRRSSMGNLREDILQLMPTPNTMDHLPARTPEQKAANKGKGGYSNVRETVVNDLLPTPIVRDYKDGSADVIRDAQVQTDTVARAVFSSGEVSATSWGKFEPAIRRWENVTGRPAPAPTKPDGKEGQHRLSSRFTEWMMGLTDGWITDCGLSRNEELKACGNGVVPQQAVLALRQLLAGVTAQPAGGGQVNLPTPTVSDTFTGNLASTQQKPGSMHSVTLPQIAVRIGAEQ